MKLTATILLLSGLLWAQSQSRPEYPLTLTVTSAQVSRNATGTTTQITGYLSEGSLQQQVHIVCKGAIFSPSHDGKANTYPARYAYSHNPVPQRIKIQAREIGTGNTHEYTCTCTFSVAAIYGVDSSELPFGR